MGWLQDYPRKYYAKYEPVKVANDQGWFSVYRLPGAVYAIAEPQQFQEVNFFLICGRDRALLLDTGMGICPSRPLIEELYPGEIITVNCHCHFDHVGCNADFQPVYVYDDPVAKRIAARGLTKEDVGPEVDEDMFQFGPPEGFVPEEYKVNPYQIIPMEDGHIFDLGDRRVQVVHTPGHTNDHICLYEPDAGIFFTGDLAYLGAMYTHFDNEIMGTGDLITYRDTMKKLVSELPEDTVFYCSHNDLVMEYPKFKEIAEAFDQVVEAEYHGKGASRKEGPAAKGHDYGEAVEPDIFEFDGFSIFTKPVAAE